MNAARGLHLRYALYGLGLGFVLSRVGFSSFDEVHRMFLLQNVRLLLSFAGALVLTFVGFRLLKAPREPRAIHPGLVLGGVLFGLGWAVTGACPGVALVQLGEGRLPALATLAGILAGSALYPHLPGRLFRGDPGSCAS